MNKIPYRYDIVGSFLRSERLKHARENFNNNLISKNELKKIENEEILNLPKNQDANNSDEIHHHLQLLNQLHLLFILILKSLHFQFFLINFY